MRRKYWSCLKCPDLNTNEDLWKELKLTVERISLRATKRALLHCLLQKDVLQNIRLNPKIFFYAIFICCIIKNVFPRKSKARCLFYYLLNRKHWMPITFYQFWTYFREKCIFLYNMWSVPMTGHKLCEAHWIELIGSGLFCVFCPILISLTVLV